MLIAHSQSMWSFLGGHRWAGLIFWHPIWWSRWSQGENSGFFPMWFGLKHLGLYLVVVSRQWVSADPVCYCKVYSYWGYLCISIVPIQDRIRVFELVEQLVSLGIERDWAKRSRLTTYGTIRSRAHELVVSTINFQIVVGADGLQFILFSLYSSSNRELSSIMKNQDPSL